MRTFVVSLILTIALVLTGALLQTLIMFGGVSFPWWIPTGLVLLGIVGFFVSCVMGWKLGKREYDVMTPEEREPIHRVARRAGKEILEDYVEDREPNIARAIARGIADEL